MTLDSDWHAIVREHLRRESGALIFSGLLLTFFGWMGGGWILPAGGIDRLASMLVVGALKIGGPLFLALAAASWTGWRIWLLVDCVATLLVGAALGFYGLVSLRNGIGFDTLFLFFAVTFFMNGFRLFRIYSMSARVSNWGVVPIINEDEIEVPQRDALTYEGKSLAGELMTRTKGNMSNRHAALPQAQPLRRPDEDEDANETPVARPAQEEQKPFVPLPKRNKPAAEKRIMVRCMHSDCGALSQEHALVCSACGRPLSPHATPAAKPQSPTTTAPPQAPPTAEKPKAAAPPPQKPAEEKPAEPAPPPKLEDAPDGFLAALADDDDD